MVIWLYTIFRNEEELLPYFLQHYAPQVDRLIMFDVSSTDHSRDLIAACHKATICNYSRPHDMDDEQSVQFAAETYKEARSEADFIIWVDCDEFLWSGPTSLRELLRGYQQQNIRAIKSVGYQMVSDHFPQGDTPLIEQMPCGVRDKEYDKMAVFDPLLDVTWRPGRHTCNVNGATVYQGEIKLLHYRYLGADYFTRRNARNFSNRSALERMTNRGYHTAPDHTGKYSAAWFQQALVNASDVVNLTDRSLT